MTAETRNTLDRVARRRLPLTLKIVYTAFMAVLVPVYWYYYGPTNFLYFCDVALFLTLAGIWLESPLLVSMCAVGIVASQTLWVVDFIANLFGVPLVGITDYMFKHENSLFLRGLSLFHGWIPFLAIYLRQQGHGALSGRVDQPDPGPADDAQRPLAARHQAHEVVDRLPDQPERGEEGRGRASVRPVRQRDEDQDPVAEAARRAEREAEQPLRYPAGAAREQQQAHADDQAEQAEGGRGNQVERSRERHRPSPPQRRHRPIAAGA